MIFQRRPVLFRICTNLILVLAFSTAFFPDVATAATVSLHVIGADVRSVLASIAQLGGVGLVLDDSVKGTVTIEIDDIEARDALSLIASARGLSLGEVNGVILITAAKNGGQGIYRPHVFKISYADLATVKAAVELSLMPYDNRRPNRTQDDSRLYTADDGTTVSDVRARTSHDDVRIIADPVTNSIVLYGTEAEAEAARRTIAELDIAPRQVALEARVISIDKEAAKNLGVEWEWSKAPQYPEYTTDYETRRHVVQNADGSYTTVTEDVPVESAKRSYKTGEQVPGIFRFGRGPGGHPFEFYFAAQINALVTDGKANILARPNITTVQGKEAVINIGGEVPVPTVSVTNSTSVTSITYREAGIILRCTPRVNPDGAITARVHTEVSSPVYVESLSAYRFNKRSADTEVRLKDGETMVIGGLIDSEESRSVSKIPFLGDLPILGAFFKNVRRSKNESEVMIFLTAHVLLDEEIHGKKFSGEKPPEEEHTRAR